MNLVLYGGMRDNQDVLQMDSALSYGFTESRKTLADIADRGWTAERCVPHGGHQFNLAIAAACGLGGSESYPGIFEPFGGFADGIDVVDGYVGLPSSPGIGLEEKSSLRPILDQLA
jgi:L-alanine-DL-glutamate epimerase-like enolase superfamily enzyme